MTKRATTTNQTTVKPMPSVEAAADFELTEDEEDRIAEGMAQADRGETVSADVVMAKLRALR